MSFASSIGIRLREVFRSAFTELSWWKKRLLQLSILLLIGGAAAWAHAGYTGSGRTGAWSGPLFASGLGCLLGFVAGAAVRIFVKLAVLLGIVVAGGLYGLSALGWIELPWSSLGEITSAVSGSVRRESASLQDLLSGFLPSSAMTGLGLASGLTQRPDMDPDD